MTGLYHLSPGGDLRSLRTSMCATLRAACGRANVYPDDLSHSVLA